MSPVTDSPRRRSWLRPQFSLATLFWLMLVAGLVAFWWRDRNSLDLRLQKLEQMYGSRQMTLWGAADILGPPDDPTGSAGKSWCPARSNAVDWIEVEFDRAAPAATIDLYETYSVGCVTKVSMIDGFGSEHIIWQGTDPTVARAQTGLFQVPVPKSIKSIQRLKIEVDSTGRGSWACLDAVGLTTASGKTTWATSASATSVYGGSLSAALEKEPWYNLW